MAGVVLTFGVGETGMVDGVVLADIVEKLAKVKSEDITFLESKFFNTSMSKLEGIGVIKI